MTHINKQIRKPLGLDTNNSMQSSITYKH